MNYKDFITTKLKSDMPEGFNPSGLNDNLFGYQSACVSWACRKARSALFLDTGMGKTFCQLEWSRIVADHTGGRALVLAPLAVGSQTEREAIGFGIPGVGFSKTPGDHVITITNYESAHKFNPSEYTAIVLDESSILKHHDSKTRSFLIEAFSQTPFRLCCTATPAPNDFMEIANHAEFLGVMTREEMLAMYFVHDGGETQKWRLKGHAQQPFWEWMSSWCLMAKKPSHLGFSDEGSELPPLNIEPIIIPASVEDAHKCGNLFASSAVGLTDQRRVRRESIGKRCELASKMVNESDKPWLVWCDLNDESAMLASMIDGAIEVKGSDSPSHKTNAMLDFADGKIKALVTKPSICGFGMNFQVCSNMVFVGVSHSFEKFYQAVRRCWRFGQESEVNAFIVIDERESGILENIKRKEAQAEEMMDNLIKNSADSQARSLQSDGESESSKSFRKPVKSGRFTAIHGDCVDEFSKLDDGSIDYLIFSPPFASLYTYSNSERDMGNVKDHDQFYAHFEYLVEQMARVLAPGRLVSFHCMNLPTSKVRDGVIGIRDFRGEMIRLYEKYGFIYHSEVCIWKDPVTAMQRTKALGLLHKQLKKDSAMSRQGIPDYLVTMRKPGDNSKPLKNTNDSFPVHVWQQYASPIWMDINPNDTLQFRSAREHDDERHICPLQLEVIRRAIRLWSTDDDLVASPFMGIGSEGHVALEMGRRFLGVELKESYFRQAVKNLKNAESYQEQDLFSEAS